jgi:hypothetical protein
VNQSKNLSVVSTPFWEARWLNGVSPKDLAPSLFDQARFKFRTVAKELRNWNWIRNLKQTNTEQLLDEFILLFSALNGVQLSEDKDAIAWKWTSSGDYSAASAYDIRFLGAVRAFRASTIWKASTEPRCRSFAWLALQGKAPTGDNLMKKNWPCSPHCSLCYCQEETNDHILTECNFTEAVWDKSANDLNVHPAIKPFQKGNVAAWLEAVLRAGSKRSQQASSSSSGGRSGRNATEGCSNSLSNRFLRLLI